jgi:hypothetical protein
MLDLTPLQQVNKECRAWARQTETLLQTAAPLSSGDLAGSIKGRTKSRNDEPYAISYSYLRYGIWRHRGAGAGAGGSKGSQWKDKNDVRKRTNPKSLGRMGAVRTAHPWIEPVLEERIPILSDLIARHLSDTLVKLMSQG